MNKTTTRAPRKETPKHLGRRTEQERAELEARQKIHVPRRLRDMLLALPYDMSSANEIMKTVKHWLMDCAHERRMKGELDEQNVIERLIEMADEGKPYGTPDEMLNQIFEDLK